MIGSFNFYLDLFYCITLIEDHFIQTFSGRLVAMKITSFRFLSVSVQKGFLRCSEHKKHVAMNATPMQMCWLL